MAKFETFDRDIRLATESISAEAISAELAAFAKQELARTIATGEGSPVYRRFVDQVEGAPEESVTAPGPILYVFSWWTEVIAFALAELIKRSPRKSGRYAESFIVLVNGAPMAEGMAIPGDAEVIITNVQPYTRKVQVGAMAMTVPAYLFDGARSALSRKFGGSAAGYSFETRFLNLPRGIHALVPYVLKGEYAQMRRAQLDAASSGRLAHGTRRLQRRKDLEKGQSLTYPALVLNMVQ